MSAQKIRSHVWIWCLSLLAILSLKGRRSLASFTILLLIATLAASRDNWTSGSVDLGDHCIETQLRLSLISGVLQGQIGISDLWRGLWNAGLAAPDPYSVTGQSIADRRVQTTLWPLNSLAHWISAFVAVHTGSCVRAFNYINALALAGIYGGLTILVSRAAGSSTAALAFMLMVAASTSLGVDVIGHEILGSYFYPQLVGELLLVGAALSLLSFGSWLGRDVAIAHVWLLLVGSTHLLPATTALGVFTLYFALAFFEGSRTWLRLVICLSIIASMLLNLLANPVTWGLIAASRNNGSLIMQLEPVMYWIYAAAFLYSGYWLLKRLRMQYARPIWLLAAVVFSASAFAVFQAAVLHLTGHGSPYAVSKHLTAVYTLVLGLASAVLVRATVGRPQSNNSVTSHCGGSRPTTVLWRHSSAALSIAAAIIGSAYIVWLRSDPVVGQRNIAIERSFVRSIIDTHLIRDGGVALYEPTAELVTRYWIDYWFLGNTRPDALSMAFGLGPPVKMRYSIGPGVDVPQGCMVGQVAGRSVVDTKCAAELKHNRTFKLGTSQSHAQTEVTLSGSWSGNEAWGRWSLSPSASLEFELPESIARVGWSITLNYSIYVNKWLPDRRVEIALEGSVVDVVVASRDRAPRVIEVPAEPQRIGSRHYRLGISCEGATSPNAADPANPDNRPLCFGLSSFAIRVR